MKEIILLLLTFAILAVQYHLGLMRKPGFGAVLPAALAALFLAVSFLEQTTEYGITGLLCVLAVAAAWGAGRLKAGKHEKAQLDRMKAKTYEKSRRMPCFFQLVKNLCQDVSVRVIAGELEGAAARLEWDRMP